MENIIKSLQKSFPKLRFSSGNTFAWSPETQEVIYPKIENRKSKIENQNIWALLHETGHALLEHKSYQADVELLKMEVSAWEKAKELAAQLKITIDEGHIQDCLDTYRDWLHARSICPTCTTKALQQSDYRHYRCHNCHTAWKVTPSRFARPYRAVKGIKQSFAPFSATEAL